MNGVSSGGATNFLDFASAYRSQCQQIMLAFLQSENASEYSETAGCEAEAVSDDACDTVGDLTARQQCYLQVYLIADSAEENLAQFLENLPTDNGGCAPLAQTFPSFCMLANNEPCAQPNVLYDLDFFSLAVPSNLSVNLTRGACGLLKGYREPGSEPSLCPHANTELSRYAHCTMIVDYLACCSSGADMTNPNSNCYSMVIGTQSCTPQSICNWLNS
jgi:hypothetical protein